VTLQQPPYQLGSVAGDLDISSVTIHEDVVEIDGDATVEVELFGADGNAFSQGSLPLSIAQTEYTNSRNFASTLHR
jgi:hypothetical protein